jgi:hypothetical protein
MAMRNKSPRYGSYLLRFWEVRSDLPGKPSSWRFSLEEPGTGLRYAFSDLEALLAHLVQALVGEDARASSAQGRGSE